MKFIHQLIFCTLLLCAFHSSAQKSFYYFNHLSTENGLSNAIINDITQDGNGYYWIATLNGLQRFDGNNFVTFRHDPNDSLSIPSNQVFKLLIDKRNNLWIVTSNKVWLYDNTTNNFKSTPFSINLKLPDKVTNFFQAEDGHLWLSISNGKNYRYDPYKLKMENQETESGYNFIIQDPLSSTFWFAQTKSVVMRKSGLTTQIPLDSIISNKLKTSFSTSKILNLSIDRVNSVWISVEGKHQQYVSVKYDLLAKTWSVLSTPFRIKVFYTTLKGSTWALGDKLYRKEEESWLPVEAEHARGTLKSAEPTSLNCLHEDRDGALWLGTNNGLFIFAPNVSSFSYTTDFNRQSLPLDYCIAAKSKTHFAIAAAGESVVHFYDNSLVRKHDKLQVSGPVSAMTFASDSFYIASKDGMIHIYDSKDSHHLNINKLNDGYVTAMLIDLNKLWIGTSTGQILLWNLITSRVDNQWSLADFNMTPAEIRKFSIDVDDKLLWIETSFDFFRLSLTKLEDKDVEPIAVKWESNVVINQSIDWKEEYFLLATSHGIFQVDKHDMSSKMLEIGSGLFNYYSFGVTIDPGHNIWVTTNGNGLFKISYGLNEMRKYGPADGVVNNTFLPGSLFTTETGIIVAGTSKELLFFNSQHVPEPLFNPRVRITSFRVNDVERMGYGIESPLELSWKDNTVSVEFSALSYIYNDQISFSYHLEGHDMTWVNIKQGERIRYSQLQPGSYTFRVQCKPISGQVVSDEASITFEIVPPFWDTWWFKLIVALSVIGVIVLVYTVRIQRILLVQEIRNKISRDLHDHIGSSLSSISIMLNVADRTINKDVHQAADVIRKISDTAHMTQENLHDIVWSIDAGKNSMRHILDRMREFFNNLFDGNPISAKLILPEELENIKLRLDKRYNLYLIFKEVLNNGVKYSQASNLMIEVSHDQKEIQLVYEDDGVGFEIGENAFGNGVENMRARAKSMGGKLTIDSAMNKGTRIYLRFPLG